MLAVPQEPNKYSKKISFFLMDSEEHLKYAKIFSIRQKFLFCILLLKPGSNKCGSGASEFITKIMALGKVINSLEYTV